MSLRKALLATTLLAVPVAAGAQPVSGVYIAGGGGFNQRTSAVFEPRNTDRAFGRATFDAGFVGLGSVGYGFGNGLRLEVEGNFRQNDADRLKGFPGSGPFRQGGGQVRTYGVMANAFYDFDLANFGLGRSIVQPYLGIGAGYAWSDYRRVNATSVAVGTRRVETDGTSGDFAYQGIAGLAFPLTQFGVPGLSLTAEYRFFGTLDNTQNVAVRSNVNNAILAGSRFDVRNLNHSGLIGLRYAFGQPPAPAPIVTPQPMPPPQGVARTYLVFFDWDRADLTGRAREIIAQAANNARSTGTTRIEVAGHADRSGTPQYNQRLSQRRAEVVAAELVRNGVPRGAIGVTAFGESRPLVPTADGVREPQNRRVEIVLR